jgi:hypothetical protein
VTWRRWRPPFWIVVGALLALRVLVWGDGPHTAPDGTPIQEAFWTILIIVAQAIWAGVQAAGEVTLYILTVAFNALKGWVGHLFDGLVELGKDTITGFIKSWEFLRATYDTVFRRGWEKFWYWVDRAHKWLDDFFTPIFKYLRFVRDEILSLYTKFVRPVLDVIDTTRKVLSVLSSLGFEWAKALDRKLLELEQKIDAPFRFALRKINEVINIIDRVVTADGLFQRLAMVRSLQRDVGYTWLALHNARFHPLDDFERARLAEQNTPPTPKEMLDNFVALLRTGKGPLAEGAVKADLRGTVFARNP